jgi:hypothetical protein
VIGSTATFNIEPAAVVGAARVGPAGFVLATDIDPRFVLQGGSTNPANMEVRVHDIVTDSLPEGAYDLIPARLVLVWLSCTPDRTR